MKKYDVGVVVGRFQIDSLHSGHIKMLSEVSKLSNRLIIFIGINNVKKIFYNPLSYDMVSQSVFDCMHLDINHKNFLSEMSYTLIFSKRRIEIL